MLNTEQKIAVGGVWAKMWRSTTLGVENNSEKKVEGKENNGENFSVLYCVLNCREYIIKNKEGANYNGKNGKESKNSQLQ